MAFTAELYGNPRRVLEDLIYAAQELRDKMFEHGGNNPNLYNVAKDSYYDSDVGTRIYCGRVYSDQGYFHDCGVSFHTYISNGKCKIWSPNGHRAADPKHEWGTCQDMAELWYACVDKVKGKKRHNQSKKKH